MKILMTEVGNASPGDEAITIAAARRLLSIGMKLTIGFRTSLEPSFYRSRLNADHLHLPIQPIGPHHSTIDSLVSSVKISQPIAYQNLCKAVADSNAVCVAPGGKYLDGFDNALKLITISIARKLGVPYYILHQSVGPITNSNDASLIREVFEGATLVVAREDMTYAYLQDLLPSASNIVLGGDAALPEEYPQSDSVTFALGINLRWSSIGHSTLEGLHVFLSKYRSNNKTHPILIYSTTTSLPSDVVALAAKFDCACRTTWIQNPDYLRLVGSCHTNISDSLHGVLFSIKARVPAISLQPDMNSWKLKALKGNQNETLNIFPSLRNSSDAELILAEVNRIQSSSQFRDDILCRQAAILDRGNHLAILAWNVIYDSLLKTESLP